MSESEPLLKYRKERQTTSKLEGKSAPGSSAGTSKPHTHGQFKTAHLGLVVRARIGYLESLAFRCRAVTLD
jgi:hypothetical protein